MTYAKPVIQTTASEIGDKIKPGLTVASFISEDGIDYTTMQQCKKMNPGKSIYAKIKETGGTFPVIQYSNK